MKRVWVDTEWWNRNSEIRAKTGSFPSDGHDFVSIHDNRRIWGDHDAYSLCSPLCWVYSNNDNRPEWESWQFPTYADALAFATALTNGTRVVVVDCTDHRETRKLAA